MDRLHKAVEKARAERQGSIGQLDRYRSNVDNEEVRLVLPAGLEKARHVSPASITYSRTKVVKLNDSVLEENRVIAGTLGDERVEAYRQLRTQVLHTLNGNSWASLAITSPMQDAGKTLTAVNLAISLSQEIDHSVLLVDLDLSQPNVHTTLGIDIDLGVIDIIKGDATVEEVLINPSIPRLSILPSRPLVDYSSEFLTSPSMRALLDDITGRYESRIVIFDLPPLLRNDDALKFTPYADATLLVIEAGKNDETEIERSLHLMKNANLIGTILNKAR